MRFFTMGQGTSWISWPFWNSRSTSWRRFRRGRSCRRIKASSMHLWTYKSRSLRMNSSSRKIRDRNNCIDCVHGLLLRCSPCTWHYLCLRGKVFISFLILYLFSHSLWVFHSCTRVWRRPYTSLYLSHWVIGSNVLIRDSLIEVTHEVIASILGK